MHRDALTGERPTRCTLLLNNLFHLNYPGRLEQVICSSSGGVLRSAHTAVFMCFVWVSEETAIISLYDINWLVFITETQCVYCAVRTGYLYIIQVSFSGL